MQPYDAFLTWAAKEIPPDSLIELRGAVGAAAFIFRKNAGAVQNDIRERRERMKGANNY